MALIKDTQYFSYIKEREGCDIFENDHGFIIYKIKDSECFIVDMFIEKNARRFGHSPWFIDELAKIVKPLGCKVITANIHLWDENCTSTMSAAIFSGFKISAAQNDILLISKALE